MNYFNLNAPPSETVIWRYMDITKFISLIKEKMLFFCRMDLLTDKYEGTVPIPNQEKEYNRIKNMDFITLNRAQNWMKKEIEDIEKFKKYTLVNCWSIDNYESFALWKIYLNNQDKGIAIKSTVGLLQASFLESKDEIKIGKVNYLDYNKESVSGIKQQIISLTKNKYYKFENELRAIIFNQFDFRTHDPLFKCGKYVKVDLNTLVKEIYISPMAPIWFINLIAKLLSNALNENYMLKASIYPSAIRDIL